MRKPPPSPSAGEFEIALDADPFAHGDFTVSRAGLDVHAQGELCQGAHGPIRGVRQAEVEGAGFEAGLAALIAQVARGREVAVQALAQRRVQRQFHAQAAAALVDAGERTQPLRPLGADAPRPGGAVGVEAAHVQGVDKHFAAHAWSRFSRQTMRRCSSPATPQGMTPASR